MAKHGKGAEQIVNDAPLTEVNLEERAAAAPAGKPDKKGRKIDRNKKPNIFKRMGRAFKEMFSELKKVTWLTPKDAASRLATVLLVVVIFLLVIFFFDWGCSALLHLLVPASAA